MDTQQTIARYEKLRTAVLKAAQEAQQAEGALGMLMQRLKKEWNCSTLEEAEAKLAEMQRNTEAAHVDFEKALTKYQKKWKKE